MNMKIVLFTNSIGLRQFKNSNLLQDIVCVVIAHNRNDGLNEIESYCRENAIQLVIQPSFKSEEYPAFVKQLESLAPTHIISNQYSLIIRPDIINIVGGSAVNIHWAKLPKNRGPNPVQWALIKDERDTGVTVHLLSDTIDEGAILLQKVLNISEDDTWVSLMGKLENIATAIIENELLPVLKNLQIYQPQNEEFATTNFRLSPQYPHIKPDQMSDRDIFNLIRAQVAPLAGAYLLINGEEIRFRRLLTIAEVEKLRSYYSEKKITELQKLTH